MSSDADPQSWFSQPVVTPEPSSQLSSDSKSRTERRIYRPARPLPYELRQHVITFVEEELYSQAISLLLNLLIAGSDNQLDEHGRVLPAYVPQPQIIALAATLVVHPSMTNRALSAAQVQAADDALFYLNHLNALVGPANVDFCSVFQFSSASLIRGGRRLVRINIDDSPLIEEDQGRVHIALANEGSLFHRAEDFWQIVGWAFNCSIHHAKRWDRWKVWLAFMLDVLEDDLEGCLAAARVKLEEGDQSASDTTIAESLIARYLASVGHGRVGKTRVMRAILADGSKRSLAEFGELWKNETKERNPPEDNHYEEKELDFDADDNGDYMKIDDKDDEESQDSWAEFRTSTPVKSPKTTASDDGSTAGQDGTLGSFGGVESVMLRQRLMALLAKLCINHEEVFLDQERTIDLFAEFLRHLPLSAFTQFIVPTVPYLDPHWQTSLDQELLSTLISTDAPDYQADRMRQAEFERYFLPYPAKHTNYVDNAKVSILVEGLLKLLAWHDDLEVTSSLLYKLGEGIKARKRKAESGAKRRAGNTEAEADLAVSMLDMSAMRMRVIVDAAG